MSKKSEATKAAAKPKPDLVCSTNTTPESVVDVKVAKLVTVTYRFFPAMASDAIHLDEGKKTNKDSKSLEGVPVLVGYVEDGKIFSCTGDTVRRMPGATSVSIKPKGKAKDGKSARKSISVNSHILPVREVRSGKAFGLLLGVDTKKNYRKYPLYQVTPKDNDVVVDVYEIYGKHSADSTATLKETREENGMKVDYYEARLSGDLWKKISHPYTSSDVDTLLETDLPDKGKQAIKDIYDGKLKQANGTYTYEVRLDDKTILLKWGGGTENARNNITNLDVKTELFTRVEPNTYGALLKAAIDASIDEVTITSGWRPMLGKSAHRLGLGLDVTYVKHGGKNHHMNRQYGRGNENLTQAEKDAYKDVAEKEKALKDAKRAKKSKDDIQELEKSLATANETLKKEIKSAPLTTEPKPVKDFRKTLLGLVKVKQVMDPWYIDKDAGDNIDPEINMLGHGNSADQGLEELHAHHLHITVADMELGVIRGKK